jgi:N-acetylmuramoyl-L-alanine amidase
MSRLSLSRVFSPTPAARLGATFAVAACLGAWSAPAFAGSLKETSKVSAKESPKESSKESSKSGNVCVPSAFRVMLDVGHTAAVPGALSARGVTEYSFNMQLTDAIKQALVDAGFDQTIKLITATPPGRGLFERAIRANAAHADLFIAIHHDAVPDALAETWEYEGKKQQYSDRFSGYSIFVSNDNGDRDGSRAFGHLLGQELQKQGLHYTPHYTLPIMKRFRHDLIDAEAGVYRYDHLVVLRATRMPAVLLEAGSIVNRQEELELGTPERRLAVAKAVTAAVTDFCATHPPSAAKQAKESAAGNAAAIAPPSGSRWRTRRRI